MGRFTARHEPRRLVPGAFNSITDDDEIQHDLAPGETGTSFGSRGVRTGLKSLRGPAGQSAMQPPPTAVHFDALTLSSLVILSGVLRDNDSTSRGA